MSASHSEKFVLSQHSLHKIWFDRILAKGHGRFSLLYRRSLLKTGIDFTRRQTVLWTVASSVAKKRSALNLTRSKKLWHQVRLDVEPP